LQAAERPAALARDNAGSSKAARMAMMAITTSSSMSVKPGVRRFVNRVVMEPFYHSTSGLATQPWNGAALLILTEAAALALAGELVFLRRAPLASCPANYFVFIWTQLSPFGISW
jgi:hypothetical protein